MFGSLLKIGIHLTEAVVKAPFAVVQDVFTIGGAITDKKRPYSVQVLKDLKENLEGDADEM